MKAIALTLIALFFLKLSNMIKPKYLASKGLFLAISFAFIAVAFILVLIE